ncbi:MAG: dual specificity protein phosphatase family protein, partial [Promethearchaeota archaeon]
LLLRKYQEEGISVIINCSEFDNQKDIPQDFTYYHINVPDYGIPTKSQIEKFLSITKSHSQEKGAIFVHCAAGCGRTAQFIIAWACNNGYIPRGMDPVNWIRKLRPCSLETKEQEDFARKICKKYRLNL